MAATRDDRTGLSPHLLAVTLFLGLFIIWAAGMTVAIRASMLPPEKTGIVLAVFAPGSSDDGIVSAIVNAGGSPLRQTWLPFMWTAHSSAPGFVGRLKAEGAVSALADFPFSPQLGGCLAYASGPRNPISLRRSTP